MSFRTLALINKDNIVENVIVMPENAEEYDALLPILEKEYEGKYTLVEATSWNCPRKLYSNVTVGWTWDGKDFVAPEPGLNTVTEEDLKRAEEMLKRDQELSAERVAQGLDAPAIAPGGTN